MAALRRALLPLAPLLLLGLVLLEGAARTGDGRRELLAAGAAVAVTQWLPGVLVWRAVRPRDGWGAEDLAAGLGVGLALAVPVQVLAVATGLSALAWAVPLLVATVVLAVPGTRERVLRARSEALPALWGLAVAVPALVLAADTWRFFDEPLRWRGWAAPHIDLPFQLSLVGELAHRWPPEDPQLAGDPLSYHWFTHAWIAHIGSVSGTALDVLLLRFVPVLLTVAVPALLAVAAVRITGRVWAGPVAVLLAFAVTALDVWGVAIAALPVNHASPTQGFGLVVALTSLTLMGMRWRGQVPLGWSAALLVPLLAVAGGAKGSVLPVLLAGCLLALAVALLRRAPRRGVVALDTATVAVTLLVLLRTLFGGDGGVSTTPFTSLGLAKASGLLGDREPTTAEILAVTLLALGAMLLPYLGALGVLSDAETRREPLTAALAGAALSGVAAVVVLTHPGQSQFYFYFTGQVLLAVLAAWGTLLLLERAPRRGWTVAAGAVTGAVSVLVVRATVGPVTESPAPLRAAALALVGFLVLVTVASLVIGRTLLARGRGAGVAASTAVVALAFGGLLATLEGLAEADSVPTHTEAATPGAFHSSQARAAHYIRDHSAPEDIVMTNRHCRRPSGRVCDPRRFFVAAYTERRVLVEGWGYSSRTRVDAVDDPEARRWGPFWEPELLALNDGFLTEPTAEAAGELRRYGVRWVFVDRTAPHARSLEPFAQLRLRTRWATVYELAPS